MEMVLHAAHARACLAFVEQDETSAVDDIQPLRPSPPGERIRAPVI